MVRRMSFILKHALEFNKFTVGLAAAGLAYVSSLFGAEPLSNPTASFLVRVIGTAGIALFAVSVLYGILIMGRATKLTQSDEKDRVDDELMKTWGVRHSSTLLVGLFVAALLMLNKIWRWI